MHTYSIFVAGGLVASIKARTYREAAYIYANPPGRATRTVNLVSGSLVLDGVWRGYERTPDGLNSAGPQFTVRAA